LIFVKRRSHPPPPQVILARLVHLDRDDIAGRKPVEPIINVKVPVNLGRVGLGPADSYS